MTTNTICRMDSSTAMDFEFERACVAINRDLHAINHTYECNCGSKICGHAKCRHWHSRKCICKIRQPVRTMSTARILFSD